MSKKTLFPRPSSDPIPSSGRAHHQPLDKRTAGKSKSYSFLFPRRRRTPSRTGRTPTRPTWRTSRTSPGARGSEANRGRELSVAGSPARRGVRCSPHPTPSRSCTNGGHRHGPPRLQPAHGHDQPGRVSQAERQVGVAAGQGQHAPH